MKRKLTLLIALMMCFAIFITGCAKDSADTDKEVGTNAGVSDKTEDELWKEEPMYGKTIKIGYGGGLCTGAPALAKAMGSYEKEGIDVEVVSVQDQSTAIGTNQVQVATNHIATLLVPSVNGVNMVFTTGAQTGCKSLYVLDNDTINSTKDLIGKTVAIPDGIGGSDHNIGLRFFNHDNISPKEINFKQVETSASILAMQNGEIDAVVLSDQFAEKFVEDGTLKYIRSLTWDEDFKVEPCCVHAFNKTFVEENPITAKKMTRIIKDTALYISENTEEATKILFDNNWASGDFDQAVRMMSSYDWKISDENSEKALISIINDYKEFGLIDAGKDTEELLAHIWNPLLTK